MATTLNPLLIPGSQVQVVHLNIGTSVVTSVTFPTSGVLTQSDGAQIATLSVTPRFASSNLLVTAHIGMLNGLVGGNVGTFGLYRDDGNCIAVSNPMYTNTYFYGGGSIMFLTPAGTTTQTTFKLRGGSHNGTSAELGKILTYGGSSSVPGAYFNIMEISA